MFSLALGLSLNLSPLRGSDDWEKVTQNFEELISQLGSDEFAEREAATRKFAEIGKPAIARLKAAFEGDDPEIRMRAQYILYQILPETQPREILSLGQIGDGQRIAVRDGVYEKILIEELNGNAVIDSGQIVVGEIRIGSINGLAKLHSHRPYLYSIAYQG